MDDTYTKALLETLRKNASAGNRVTILVSQDSDNPQFIISNPDKNSSADENIFGAQQRFIGLISDDDGVQPDSLEIRIMDIANNTAVLDWTELGESNISGSGISVRWDYSANLPDGDYSISIQAEDIYGKNDTSSEAPFKVISEAPMISINTPTQGTYIGDNSNLTVTGTSSGYGNRTVEVSTDAGVNWTPVTATSGDSNYSTWSYVISSSNFAIPEGPFLLKFRVKDGQNNYGYYNLQIIGDTEAPQIEVLSPNTEIVNSRYTVSGEVIRILKNRK